jgi:hypothetical protein
MTNFLDSASSQKLSKLNLSDSFNSDCMSDRSEIGFEDISNMIDQVYSTLIKSKLLPKDYPKPSTSLENLNNLINTLCDEFLLETDQPATKTHDNSGNVISKEFQADLNDENGDLISKIFYANRDIMLSEKNCKDLSALIIELARKSKTSSLKKHKDRLEEKVIRYGEELMRSKKVLKLKEIEIQNLRSQIEELKYEKEVPTSCNSACRFQKYSYEKDLSESTDT